MKQDRYNFLSLFCKGSRIFLFLLFSLLSHTTFAQTDFLGIPSITLEKQVYTLKWSANVRRTRIIEEYLLPKESLTRYNTKLILEYIQSGKTIEYIVEARLAELAEGKENGRVLSYQRLESDVPGEIVLEFMVGDIRGGINYGVEWNVYRYISEANGVLLFIMSKRAYEEKGVNVFMKEVSQNRLKWIDSIVNYKLPAISRTGER